MAQRTESKPAEKRRGGFKPGVSGNPGGRSKQQKEAQELLNREFRTPEMFREELLAARALGLRGDKGDAAYLKAYWERVWGPVKDIDIDLSDAPPDVIAFLSELRN